MNTIDQADQDAAGILRSILFRLNGDDLPLDENAEGNRIVVRAIYHLDAHSRANDGN